ncbi:MAG: hypothetical protein QG567_157 [Campylobacterota bacterium]|nr:hypothetical protein [Campylobacterota bacterium]
MIPKNLEHTMKKQTIKIPKPKSRVTWGFNPVERVKQSKKIYSRKNKMIYI